MEKDRLYDLSENSPRKFWKLLKMKRRNEKVKDNVDINGFFEHFKNVSNIAHTDENVFLQNTDRL